MVFSAMGSKWLQLPSSMLLTAFAFALASRATGTAAPTPTGNVTQKPTIATTGSGPEYASACWKALIDYDVSSSSWDSAHQWISTTTEFVGGTSFSDVTYYESATTLCDGHARVTYSPAKSLSTGTITHPGTVTSTKTILGTYFSAWSQSAPTCSIAPSDCDGLWKAYSTSLSAAGGQTTNPPLETPPCMGRSAASSYASVTNEIYGCGDCTIFGEGVELVYFPTYPSSRDMCAMTPTASLTHYGSDAVITAYAGKSFGGEGDASGKRTAVADGHTFTSGTAYISISTVYAVDRCSKTFGTPVKDAILAMPSESVLSLRYSQDHFQRLMSTDKVTGYPVSYADFNTPIPWSAWNGQNLCDPGGYGGWACSIIYEHSFRPQLAIPPQITQLSPEFEKCQMWYNGLWDPPLALTEASEEDKPTAPGEHQTKQTAAPNSAPAAPTTTRTALANELPTTSEGSDNGRPTLTAGGPTLPASRPTEPTKPAASCVPDAEPWVQSFHVGSATYWATGANRQACIESATITSGGPTQTLKDGTHASYGDDGLILQGANTVKIGDEAASAVTSGAQHTGESQPDGRHTVVVTVDGQEATAVQTSNGGPIVVGTYATLTPGGSPTTLSNGEVYSAAMGGLVVGWTSTVGKDQTSPSAPDSDDSNDAASGTSAGGSASQTGSDSLQTEDGSSRTRGMPSTSDQTSSESATNTASSSGSTFTTLPAQSLCAFVAVLAILFVGG